MVISKRFRNNFVVHVGATMSCETWNFFLSHFYVVITNWKDIQYFFRKNLEWFEKSSHYVNKSRSLLDALKSKYKKSKLYVKNNINVIEKRLALRILFCAIFTWLWLKTTSLYDLYIRSKTITWKEVLNATNRQMHLA